MSRERLDDWCERGILVLTLAILVFGPLALGAVRPLEFIVIQALALGAAALWLLRLWLGERPQLLWPPVCWAVLAFTAYAIVRYLTADIEYVARQELIRVLVYALIFLVVLNNLYRQDSVQWIALTLIFLGMAIAMYAIYQFLSGSDRVWVFASQYPGRSSGTFFCPNHLAGFLGMLLPLALAYTIVGRLPTVTKVFLGYAALALVFGIAATISRGGWLATGMAVLLFTGLLFLRRSFRLPTLLLVLAVLGAGGFFASRSTSLQERFKQAFPEGQPAKAEDVRFELWRPAVQIWREHLWFGAGPAHFDRVFPAYRPPGIQLRPDRVHNDYLNTLADWGLAGAALVLAALILAGVGAKKTWGFVRGGVRDFGSNRSNKFALVLGASVGWVALLLHSVVDFNLHIPANAILAVTLLALLSAHLRFATDACWLTPRLWLKCLATLVLLAGVCYLGAQGWRRLEESRRLDRAARESFCSSEQIAALQSAFAVEPNNPDTALAIGEAYRVQSWAGWKYEELAQTAMAWFQTAMRLNPHDPYAPARQGMCLDWLDRPAEAGPLFQRAERLDPNNQFIVALIGWHYQQTGNYAAAREWFERSLGFNWERNPIAHNHLRIVMDRLAEAAAK